MPVATRTALQIMQGAADRMGVRLNGTLTASASGLLTIATGNAARYFRSARTDASNRYIEGAETYVTSGTVAVPNPNEIALTSISAGTLTPAVTYGTVPDSTATFDVYLRGVRYRDLQDALNQLLRGSFYEYVAPLTLVTDGDMDTSGITNWTASASATVTKVTGATTLWQGARALRVLAGAASQYAQSDTILVDATNAAVWFVRAVVRADVGTARLIPYDVTNAANITTEDYTNRGWGVIELQFTLPATCEALAFRLMSVANNDDVYWDSLMAYPTSGYEIALPDWLVSPKHIRQVYRGYTSDLRPDWPRWVPQTWDFEPDMVNPNRQWKVVLDDKIAPHPYAMRVLRPYAAITADADTIFMDREAAELGTAMLCCQLQAYRDRSAAKDWMEMHAKFKRDYHARRGHLRPEYESLSA